MTEIRKDLAYTVGEPAGIGSDIILRLACEEVLTDVVCIGNRDALVKRAIKLGLSLKILEVNQRCSEKGELRVCHIDLEKPEVCGVPDVSNSNGILNSLNLAIDGCMSGQYSAMVTGPIQKSVMNDAGIVFSGHTEYLAERSGALLPVMLLATESMRVALMTTHLPLKDVSQAITQEKIKQVCRIVHSDLVAKFGIEHPQIMVCGLNPHAGEGGHLGTEEIDTIIPALEALRKEGLNLVGPLPADTVFNREIQEQADITIAMYHDQGLPVLKYQGFGEAANITLGLEFIRTSVDHGTALDIAGTGKADLGSLKAAFREARGLANRSLSSR